MALFAELRRREGLRNAEARTVDFTKLHLKRIPRSFSSDQRRAYSQNAGIASTESA